VCLVLGNARIVKEMSPKQEIFAKSTKEECSCYLRKKHKILLLALVNQAKAQILGMHIVHGACFLRFEKACC
jgi:hypothetical protein